MTYDRNTGEIGINENSKAFDIMSIGSGERYMQFQQYAIARHAWHSKMTPAAG